MKTNYLLRAWHDRRQTLGGWLSIPSSVVAETMAHAGFDWLCIDTQHGLIDYKDMLTMLQAIQTTNCVALVRTSWNDTAEINKALDAGAQGLVVPLVNTPADALQAVRSMKYAMSGGIRSTGPTRAGLVLGGDYVAKADKELALLVQIETQEALDNVDGIAATLGVDALYVGPTDLAMSMGITPAGSTAAWQADMLDEPRHREALAKVLAAAKRQGKAAVMHVMFPGPKGEAVVQRLLAEGWDGVMIGIDRAWMTAGASASVQAARASTPSVVPRRCVPDTRVLQQLSQGKISVDEAADRLSKL